MFFQSRLGADPNLLKRGGKFSVVFKGFSPKRGPAPSCTAVDCALSPMLYNPVLDPLNFIKNIISDRRRKK